MAKRRSGRSVNGILVLDKPAGLSSNAALQSVKRLYNAAKAGHTGSLDPLATGVLPICFGEATKFSQYLLDSDKVYRSTFLLGVTTSSGDADGEVLEQMDVSAISEQNVVTVLKRFEGEIEQIPSMYSALKHKGQPLYKLARQGKTVERKARQVKVYTICMEAFRSRQQCGLGAEVDVYIHCSKGTYVRTIAEDLGRQLGCGAHVKMLRRVKAGPFDETQSTNVAELEQIKGSNTSMQEAFGQMDRLLKPVDSALSHLPKVELAQTAVYYLRQGQAVQVPGQAIGAAVVGTVVRLAADSGDFLGIGEMLDDGRVNPKRLVVTH